VRRPGAGRDPEASYKTNLQRCNKTKRIFKFMAALKTSHRKLLGPGCLRGDSVLFHTEKCVVPAQAGIQKPHTKPSFNAATKPSVFLSLWLL
jgi:hypothetical protein